MTRMVQSWGLDGHNSHTNVCSSSARLGYMLWSGSDRPSPDYAHAKTILLVSSHLDSGHYFNPHAQRIMEGQKNGAKLIVIDPRLSNTASKSDYWLPAYSGTEAALLLAIARHLLETGRFAREFVKRWVNWEEFLRTKAPSGPLTFERFVDELKKEYARYTFEYAEQETGVEAARIRVVADAIADAGTAFTSHIWRAAATGNLYGWQIVRATYLLQVLTGSIGTVGGVDLHTWDKLTPKHPNPVPPQKVWNELLFPKEYPLACYELSFLLPHFLKEKRGRLEVYFTRVYNPLWTNPDGFTWLEVLRDESAIGCHVALSPTWSETAWFSDYILPMGMATERHDNQSQETHPGQWVGYRQPVRKLAMRRAGKQVEFTYQANPGEVWEEAEFWIELSWRVDEDGSLGIRKHYESPYRPGQKMTVEEYFQWMFEHGVPGLPETAAKEGLKPIEYMEKYGAYAMREGTLDPKPYEREIDLQSLAGARTDAQTGVIQKDGKTLGVVIDGRALHGFETPSRKLELYSRTLAEWGWGEFALPHHAKTHVYWRDLDRGKNEFDLLPNYRLPTQIHTRAAVKWLYEITHHNPLWMNHQDAARLGVKTGDLVRVSTRIGYFVSRVWATQGLRAGIVAMSHHFGRWRLQENLGNSRLASALVAIDEHGSTFKMRQVHGVQPYTTNDPDTERVWWSDVGVHQNLTFPVQPDPVSGMHCWHQRVTVEKARPGDQYGDIEVDTQKSMAVYREWLAMTKPAPGPGGLRRPLWMTRPLKPVTEAYKLS
jgi:anaerobic selenocysteine-containing dehydrogenase